VNNKHFVISLVFSIVMAFLAVFLYDRYFTYKYYVFDLKGFLYEQRDLFVKGLISEQDVNENLDKLETYLKSLPGNYVVLVSGSVVKNKAITELPQPSNIKKYSASGQSNGLTDDKNSLNLPRTGQNFDLFNKDNSGRQRR
jgi:hypothetical protein